MSYTLVFKRYAPFKSFGGGFHGDGRAGADLSGTARTWGFVQFNINGASNWFARSSPTWHTVAPGTRSTQTPDISMRIGARGGDELTFTAHTAGANPLVPGAPDIDTFVDIRFRPGNIDGCVRGDGFPNFEAFLVPGAFMGDSCPDTYVTLSHWATPHGPLDGPARRLFGSHSGQFLTAFHKSFSF